MQLFDDKNESVYALFHRYHGSHDLVELFAKFCWQGGDINRVHEESEGFYCHRKWDWHEREGAG